MDRRRSAVIGLLTVVPWLILLAVCLVPSTMGTAAIQAGDKEQARRIFVFATYVAIVDVLWIYAVAVFYIGKTDRLEQLTAAQKRHWKLALFFLPVSSLLFWYKHD